MATTTPAATAALPTTAGAAQATTEPVAPPQYPINLNLDGVAVLVVGGGAVASHKVVAMLRSGAIVTVVAPIVDDRVRRYAEQPELAAPGQLHYHLRRYDAADLDGHRLVLTCTDDPAVNRRVWLDAQDANIWCNSADDPPHCDWTLPAVVRNGPLQVTVSTSGKSPGLSKWLRIQLESQFRGDWDAVLAMLDELRRDIRAEVGTSEIAGWIEAFDAGAIDVALDGDLDGARHLIRTHLATVRTAKGTR